MNERAGSRRNSVNAMNAPGRKMSRHVASVSATVGGAPNTARLTTCRTNRSNRGFSHHSAAIAIQSRSWNAACSATAIGKYTASHTPHNGRHHARAIWKPRSSASHPPRGRSCTLKRSRSTGSPEEDQVTEHDAPQERADEIFRERREESERRPERLDERGDEEHGPGAVHQPHRWARRGDERGLARDEPRREHRAPEPQACRTGDRDRHELHRAVAGHEGPERSGVPALGKIAGDGADEYAVEDEVENRAQPERKAGGERLEADLHVVPDVEAEHRDVVVGGSPSQARVRRVVHFLHLGEVSRFEQVINKIRHELQHGDEQYQRSEEETRRCEDERALFAHEPRKSGQEELDRARDATPRPRTVEQ